MSTPGSQRQLFRDVLHGCAKAFDVPERELLGDSRTKQLAQARLAAYSLARELTRLSLHELGEAFNRDHSTVFQGVRAAARLAKKDEWFADQVKRARAKAIDLKRARLV